MYGAFQIGANNSSKNIKKVLNALWQLLHDSPGKRVNYMSVTGSDVFTLAFCVTQWVECKKAADWAILIWPSINGPLFPGLSCKSCLRAFRTFFIFCDKY